MYTLNKSYINTKKIKHLQCKKCSSVVNFHPGNRSHCQAGVLLPGSPFGFYFIFFPYLFFSPLTQNTMRNLEPLGKEMLHTWPYSSGGKFHQTEADILFLFKQ